jgi:hypothetical protein
MSILGAQRWACLAENPRIHVHFIRHSMSGSWLNVVEIWFGIIERHAIHRGEFTWVTDLMRTVPYLYVESHNQNYGWLDIETAIIHTVATVKKEL